MSVNGQTLLWVFVVLFTLRIATQIVGQSLSMYLGKQVQAQLSSEAFAQVMHHLSIRDINKQSIGFYTSLSGDEASRASSLTISMVQFISVAILSLLYYIAIARYSPITALMVGVFMLCSIGILYWVAKASQKMGELQVIESRKATSLFLDSLNNIKTVRALSVESYVVSTYKTMIFGYTRILFSLDFIALVTRLVPILLLLLLLAGWTASQGPNVVGGGLAFIVTMIIYLMRFFPTVGQGVNLLLRIAADARSGRDVTELIKFGSSNHGGQGKHIDHIHDIRLNDVGFRYDENSDKTVLHSINFKLVKGKSYALVGPSGIGKSTLVDILLKFYDPTSGQIYFNADVATELSEADIRQRVTLVSQEAAIFDDTVMHNICLGREASDADVRRVCELACIHDVIEAMPNGYMTRLQYQGSNLSGGQRQRIAIARALLRNPDVLILDESTTALDKQTQQHVLENIFHAFEDKIVIFVTHDPHVINKVSEIIDLEESNRKPHESVA
jgi:ABC-type bacteriocin/lantibiotic exporter with double-glycine peptidase domain